MKSQRECYEKLLEGKRLRLIDWDKGHFIYFAKDGHLVNEDKINRSHGFADFEDWEVYGESEKIEGLPSGSGLMSAYAKINELVKAVNKLMEEKCHIFITNKDN
jgi:hypothetical protein